MQAPRLGERENPGRQPRQHRLQIGALALNQGLAALGSVAGLRQTAGHLIERPHQETQFVAAGTGQLLVELPGGDRLGAAGQFLQRPNQLARGMERRPEPRQHRQQQDQREGQGKAGLERCPQENQFPVAVEGCLHRVREQTQPIRHRKQGLQQPLFAADRHHPHYHPDMKAGIADRLETDVIAALAYLQQHCVRRRFRHDQRRVGGGGGDDAVSVSKQGQFGGLADIEPFVQPPGGLLVIAVGHGLGNPSGLLEHFAHAQIQGGPAEFQRILETLIDLDVEPAIDPPLQEMQREAVDQCHRGHGQHRKDPGQPQRQARARHVLAVQANQPDQVVQNQEGQRAQADGAEQQQPGIHLPELRRVGGGAAHQYQDDQQQAQQRQRRQPALTASQPANQSGHSYHSLASRQSSEK